MRVALIAFLLLMGCVTEQGLSQGIVPCRPDEMTIEDEKRDRWDLTGLTPGTWTVICHEKRYYCSAHGGDTDCVQADE